MGKPNLGFLSLLCHNNNMAYGVPYTVLRNLPSTACPCLGCGRYILDSGVRRVSDVNMLWKKKLYISKSFHCLDISESLRFLF